MKKKIVETDVLIIGGGTAGCYAAIYLGEHTDLKLAVVDKAAIKRSGCLAAGVNALNAYITEGHEPMDYVRYASDDAHGIVREDLLLDICERLNHVTEDMEKRGLKILKDRDGKYVSRGWRNLKINGENIKPILERNVKNQKNVSIYEHVDITDLRYDSRVCGAYGFGINDSIFYIFKAKAVLVATGGAAGIYKPNNPERMAHQMWYCPFNTGAGYCMGILAGAEMTTFEMRFIALRCKDTIAPTGTLAQGIGARQINSSGEIYEQKYGLTTSQRLWGTVKEKMEGRGPCFLKTSGIDEEVENDLYRAYLNMAPIQTLKWVASKGPGSEDVEIEGTEPYIVGGHTASGYWVDKDRMTTLKGLFAAGDVAGGAPQKYVTGALAEGEIAAEGIIKYLEHAYDENCDEEFLNRQSDEKLAEYEQYIKGRTDTDDLVRYEVKDLETSMQKVMDEYAGGISADYGYTSSGLRIADKKIVQLLEMLRFVMIQDTHELLKLYELRERLIISRVLIAHLKARKETRWHGFQENLDFPNVDDEYRCYINSVMDNEGIRILKRDLITVESS